MRQVEIKFIVFLSKKLLYDKDVNKLIYRKLPDAQADPGKTLHSSMHIAILVLAD